MRIQKILLLALAAMIAVLGHHSRGAFTFATQGDKDTAKSDLTRLENDWARAVESNDANRIAPFLAADFLFVGAGGVLQDREQHLDDFRTGRLKVKSVKIETVTIHSYLNAAVASCKVAVVGTFADQKIDGPYQFTDTWINQDKHWLAAARQQTAIRPPSPKEARRPREGHGAIARKRNAIANASPLNFNLGNFPLESGQTLNNATLVYTVRGTLNADKSNAVLIGSPYGDDDTAHDFLIGPGQAIDPAVDFIIATNQLGNGKSSSPSNTPAPQHGADFPQVAIRDDVEASFRLITQEFGIKKLKAVVGFSMGGQQALQWAVSHPDSMRAIVAICSTAREYPFGFARLEGAKGAITGDSSWNGGRYTQPPLGGLEAIGLHWVAWAYSPEWWRRGEYQTAYGRTLQQEIDHWGQEFVGEDANDLLLQANKWQRNDVGQTPPFGGSLENALRSIKARVLRLPSETDQYFLAIDTLNESRFIPDVEVAPIATVWGHTGGGGSDTNANRFLNRRIKRFFESVDTPNR